MAGVAAIVAGGGVVRKLTGGGRGGLRGIS